MADSDLSDYELQRLANIKRNNALLDRLGLGNHPLVPKVLGNRPKPPLAGRPPASKKRGRFEGGAPSRPPTRVSKRLRQQEESSAAEGPGGENDAEEEEEDHGSEEEEDIDYDTIPVEPADLDDNEFQAYVKLKKWRLDRSRELELE